MTRVSEKSQAIVSRAAKWLLHGVGELPSKLERHKVAIHYRRGLTDAEIAQLDPAWCAITPVSEAGDGFVLEENT